MPNHPLRHLLPTFVIPVGTQVVLKVAKPLPSGQAVKPPGSVGVVVDAPTDNRHAYTVRFADDQIVTAYFHELAIRRRELADELVQSDEHLRRYLIYQCQVGSRAYGLAT